MCKQVLLLNFLTFKKNGTILMYNMLVLLKLENKKFIIRAFPMVR